MGDTFTLKQKAQIYARDMGFCQATGKSLFILDDGFIDPGVNQIDHIHPKAKGGTAEITNGRLLWYSKNQEQSDNSRKWTIQFINGYPTEYAFFCTKTISKNLQKLMIRHVNIVESDYYFNSAVQEFLWGISAKLYPYDRNGNRIKRTASYNAKSVVRSLERWRNNLGENYKTFEERGLIKIEELESDQKLLLGIRNLYTFNDVMAYMRKIAPILKEYYKLDNYIYRSYRILGEYILSDKIRKNDLINYKKYIEQYFKPVIIRLNKKDVLPRYRKIWLENIAFLKKYAEKIMKKKLKSF